MAKLTDEQKKHYLNDQGGHCPWCGSQRVTVENCLAGAVADGSLYETMSCDTCGKRWDDLYAIVNVVEDADGAAEEPDPAVVEAKRDERLAEEVLAAQHMGQKRTIGKVVCAECGSDNVVAFIEERTWYYPPEKAAWPVDDAGYPLFDESIELVENEGSKKDTDTTDSGWWCLACDNETVVVVPAAEPVAAVQA